MLYQNKDLLELVNREVAKIAHFLPTAQFYEGFSKVKLKEKNAHLKSRPVSSSHCQAKARLYSIVTEVASTSHAKFKACKELQAKKVTLKSTKQSRSWHCGRTTPVSQTITDEKEPPVFCNAFLNQKITESFKEKQKRLKRFGLNSYKRKEVLEKDMEGKEGEKKSSKVVKKGQGIYRYQFGSKEKLFIRQTLR